MIAVVPVSHKKDFSRCVENTDKVCWSTEMSVKHIYWTNKNGSISDIPRTLKIACKNATINMVLDGSQIL